MFFSAEKYKSLIEQLTLILYLIYIITILVSSILAGIFIKNMSLISYIFGGIIGIAISIIMTIPIRIKIEKMKMELDIYLLVKNKE